MFRKYDIVRDEYIVSQRMATHACIKRIGALLISGTEIDIERVHLDSDGMTTDKLYEIKARTSSSAKTVVNRQGRKVAGNGVTAHGDDVIDIGKPTGKAHR